jgi:predicted PurR-regulated permease PerM
MRQNYSLQNKVFFYLILAILAGLGLWLVSSYLGVIVFSLVMVIILKPVFSFFERLLGGRSGWATLATLLALLLVLIIPGWIMVNVISSQVDAFVQSFGGDDGGEPFSLENFQARLNNLVDQVPFLQNVELSDEQLANIRNALQGAGAWAARTVLNLGMSIPGLIARLFIFLAIVGVLLPNYHHFVQRVLDLSPLDDEVDRLSLLKIKAMVWSMFIGIAVIALIQGLITGLFIWLGNVPYAPLWTLIAIVASTLPLGASIIAIPIAIFQLIVGNPVGALIILAGYILIVTNIDNIIRPKLVSKDAYLSAALVLVAALGGYELFGFFGVIYGPVLMVLLTTAIQVYGDYYSDGGQAASSTSPETGQAEVPTLGEASADTT